MNWIKVQIGTPNKPEVMRMARRLKISRDEVIGKLVRVWSWFDSNSIDGVVDGVVDADVDALVDMDGFANAMVSVGWLSCDAISESVTMPNFHKHNGESSKKRALKSQRQSNWRKKRDAPVDVSASTKASTREEKRREDNNIPLDFSSWPEKPSEQVFNDWLAMRKRQKAEVSQTVINRLSGELNKAHARGMSVDDCLSECVTRGWRGFRLEWVIPDSDETVTRASL